MTKLADYYNAKYGPVAAATRAAAPGDNVDGVMVAFMLTPEQADQYAMDHEDAVAPDQLHVTLTYNAPTMDDLGAVEEALNMLDVVQTWAKTCPTTFEGEISGPGVFTAGPDPVTVALVDLPEPFGEARARLVTMLTDSGIKVFTNHGYTPHISLAYADLREDADPGGPITFNTVTVMLGAARYDYALGTGEPTWDWAEAWAERNPVPIEGASPTTVTARVDAARAALTVRTEQARAAAAAAAAPVVRPFLTEHAGKIMVTAPAALASADGLASFDGARAYSQWDQNVYVSGRFVGATTPNRNNVMWSPEDLKKAVVTVPNSPLDWLHQRKFLIGTFVDARYVEPTLDSFATDGLIDPYIEALSVVWGHQYPAVAQVVEEASDTGQLWYSMECVADHVTCTGPGGCGNTYDYYDYRMNPALVCRCLRAGMSTKHLINPTFRGGAIIVPPTRPGWGQADARVMESAMAEAELAYEQAGSPADTPVEVFAGVLAQVWAHTDTARDAA